MTQAPGPGAARPGGQHTADATQHPAATDTPGS